jgi:S-DNA-T family DNA segregation ATPase FtsK/SpoIIIE
MNLLKLPVTPTRNRRLNELVGLMVLVAATLLVLALVSYRPTDPSIDTVAAAGYHIHNWIGPIGARVSDLLLQFEGLSAFGLPLVVAGLAWKWLRSTPIHAAAVKLASIFLCLTCGPAIFAVLPDRLRLLVGTPLGGLPAEGLTGRFVADSLIAYVNLPGACVLIVSMLAIGLYLVTSFSFSSAREWGAVRFAFLAAWRDRYENWKHRRAQLRAERIAARELVQQQRALDKARRKEARYEQNAARAVAGEEPSSAAAPARNVPPAPKAAPGPADGPMPTRRGSFAETEGPSSQRPVASGWDDEDFAAAIPPPTFDPARAAETTPRAALVPRPNPAAPLSAMARPELVAPSAPPATHTTDGIAFSKRADIDTRPVTVTQKAVAGFESAYKLPPSTLLHRAEESLAIREEELRAEAKVLVEKCAEFDVGGQVVQINPGPVVTTFEFRPEAGVKYSRVTGLSDDLCLAMAAESILIERMAGKSTVGIQVPNSRRETIWLRDVIENENFVNSKSKITMAMGKDINGRIVVADLATMPHVLIAGSTGSGKSVAINAMIMSILYKATPEQVRLILVDPKRVELGMYEGIPHLFTPIITEPKLAANALKNAVREMERRLKLLASKSVRNIDQYNRLFTDGTMDMFDDGLSQDGDDGKPIEHKPLPYIMIIIDELADLMILDKANVEEAITRIAQMARAVGIHLVLATQRPSVDVITGLIKANVPTRISFRLSTKVDSRTILDSNGAESLLGRGDMLFLPPGTSRVQRVHAPFVTEKEISGVVAFWKAQGEAVYMQGFLDSPKDDKGRDLEAEGGEEDGDDELFDDAVRLVFEFGKASTSLLQRRMRIGYGRAAHLIDMMERDGLVGPPEGSKPRELLKPANWLNEADSAMR